MDPAVKTRLVHSLFANNLVIVCGAGLSRAAPSSLPSAVTFAQECYDFYVANIAALDPALRQNLEGQARYFLQLGQLVPTFINQVVNWGRFTSIPNVGHVAIADFLCCKAISMAVSTNYDELIEEAALGLGEKDFVSSISVADLNTPNPRHKQLLKLHGCRTKSRNETIWCPDQLAGPPVQGRITQLAGWLQANLVGRDLVFLGFWSDWAYLNGVLQQVIAGVTPPTVVLVDPASAADLQAKAPNLWNWANGSASFFHEQMFGEQFIDELRLALSEQFFRQLFNIGAASFQAMNGAPPTKQMPSPIVSTARWYDVRRDAQGVTRVDPVRDTQPTPQAANAGLALVELNERGVVLTGAGFVAPSGKKVRVLGASGPLSLVMQRFSVESPAVQTEDVVICASAIPDPGVVSVLRPRPAKTIMRPGVHGQWETLDAGLMAI